MRPWAVLAVAAGCLAASSAWAQSAKQATGSGKALGLFGAAVAAEAYGAGDLGHLLGHELYMSRILRLRGAQAPDLRRDAFKVRADQVSVARDWPSALNLATRRLDFDVTPHAALDMGAFGRSVEAGATLSVSATRDDEAVDRLRDLGVGDGARFGDRSRWYLFAATSGRAVGLNMLHGETGWNRAGWTTDPASALVGDAQLGVGWRRGPLQSSLGYVHREVKGDHMIFGQETRKDSLLAFTLSIKPGP